MAQIIAGMAGKAAGNMLRRAGDRERTKWEDPEHRDKRKRQLGMAGIALLVSPAVAGAAYYGWIDGFGTGFAQAAHITNEVTTEGGEQTITKVDLDFKETCWTASTIDIKGSMAKVATKVGDWEMFWRNATVDLQAENKLCINPSEVSATRNSQTKEITISIEDPSAITTNTSMIPGSLFFRNDGGSLDNMGAAITEAAKGIPLVEDAEMTKLAQQGVDKRDSDLINIATITALHASVENCTAEIVDRAEEALEKGLKTSVMKGALLYEPTLTEDQITIMAGDKEFKDVDKSTIGRESNVDAQYKSLLESQKNNGDLTFNQGNKSECKAADNLGNISMPKVVTAGVK